MTPMTKKALEISGMAGIALVAAFAGGTFGFEQGYAYGLGDNAARAYTLTAALRTLRAGDVTKGLSQLESDLDSLIMEHWASNRGEPPLLAWRYRAIGDNTSEQKLLAQIARYRAEYPSAASGSEVKETITSHLKKFQ